MKNIEEFKSAAKAHNVTNWNIHDCSMCGYPCGFLINGDEVSYDSGCYCVSYFDVRPSSWGELADSYNRNAGADDAKERAAQYPKFAEMIKKVNALWGFPNPEWLT